ncbi:MAG: O-antigen ligase family protein [Pseudomonadota bacterium]
MENTRQTRSGAPPSPLECVFAVVSITILSKAFTVLFLTDIHMGPWLSQDASSSRPVTADTPALLGLYLLVYVVSGLLLLRRFSELPSLVKRHWVLALILVLPFVSALWSQNPGITIGRSIALVGTSLFGVYLALFYTWRQQLLVLTVASMAMAVGSAFIVFLLPNSGLMGPPHLGLWNGAFVHKNSLAIGMALSTIACFFTAVFAPSRSFVYWLGFWLSIVLLVLSLGKTAAIACVVTFTCAAFWCAHRNNWKMAAFAGSAALIVSIGMSSQVWFESPVASSVNELLSIKYTGQSAQGALSGDETLRTVSMEQLASGSGRAQLWSALWPYVMERPVEGHGYGGFWRRATGPAKELERSIRWWPAQAHNGFYDVAIELGLVAAALVIMLYTSLLLRCVYSSFHSEAPMRWLVYTSFLVYLGIVNLAESQLMSPNTLLWVLLVMILVSSKQADQPCSPESVTSH